MNLRKEPTESAVYKTEAEMALERIIRMHRMEEELLRWARRRHFDIQCFYIGFPEKSIQWMFENKRTENLAFSFIKDATDMEQFRKDLLSWQQDYRNTSLENLKTFDKYKDLDDDQIIAKLFADLPSDEKSVKTFIEREKENFHYSVPLIKNEIPEATIPISSRYFPYLDDNVRPFVRKCEKYCTFCEPPRKNKK